MTDKPPQPRLGIFQFAMQRADLMSSLAGCLAAEYGVSTALVFEGKSRLPSAKKYHFEISAFAKTFDIEALIRLRAANELPTDGALAQRARDLEVRLSCNINEIVRCDRHLGRGFVVGAEYPRSHYGANASYSQSIDCVIRLLEHFEELFRAERPLFVVATPSTIVGACMHACAAALGVPSRSLLLARRGNRAFWGAGKFLLPPNLKRNFDRAEDRAFEHDEQNAGASVISGQIGPTYEQAVWALQAVGEAGKFTWLVRALVRAAKKSIGNHIFRRDQVYGRYFFMDSVKTVYARWRFRRSIARERPVFDALPVDMPFTFFPLTTEPETTLMAEAPMCDNQLAIIDWLAKASPPNWRVIIKEHPGQLTPRPKGFWDRVKAYPNVIVAAPLESAEKLAARSKVVAVINGTLGFQAAVGGHPVLTFHPSFQGRLVSHVFFADSYAATCAALRKIADGDLPPLEARLREGRKFDRALLDDTMEVIDDSVFTQIAGGARVPDRQVRELARGLIQSLGT